MKISRIMGVIILIGMTLSTFAQDGRGFNYQAVARDGSGALLANTAINLRFQVVEGSPPGTIVFQETHAPTTNAFGLFNVGIGKGTLEMGSFEGIAWSSETHFLVVELNGLKIDTTEFEAVPYSKVATAMSLSDLVDVSGTAANGEILKWDGNAWVSSADETEDADADPANELQSLSLSGNDLIISNGNTVTLPAAPTYSAGSGINISGNTISNSGDLDPTNELQSLSLSGNDLIISNGNTITLPAAPTYSAGTGIAILGNVISNLGDTNASDDLTTGSSAGGDLAGSYPNPDVVALQGRSVSTSAPANGQVLKWNGSSWAPAADDDTDGDSNASNELQTLSLSGNNLSISSGNTVSVPGSVWSTAGNDTYYDAGNVGIGLSSPSYPLQVGSNEDVVFGDDLSTTGPKFFYDGSKAGLQVGRTTAASTVADSIGNFSLAQGFHSVASGEHAAAFNSISRAYGNQSFVAGHGNYADSYLQATFGRYATRSNGTIGAWVGSEPLFVVGNGLSNGNRNDAFTILKDGRIGINAANPIHMLTITNEELSDRTINIGHLNNLASASIQTGINVFLDKSNSASIASTYGGYFFSRNAGGTSHGIVGWSDAEAATGANSYGVRAISDNDFGTGSAYGLYASLLSPSTSGAKYAGYFAGNVYATGSYLPSDQSLKQNIQASGSVIPKLMDLPIKTYTYQRDRYPDMNLPTGLRTGFMAQDVAQLMPELVTQATQPAASEEELEAGATQTEDIHFQAVDYAGMVPYLVKAIQEQQEQLQHQMERIETQQAQIEALTAEVKALKQN